MKGNRVKSIDKRLSTCLLISFLTFPSCATFPKYHLSRKPAPLELAPCRQKIPLLITVAFKSDVGIGKFQNRSTTGQFRKVVEKIAKEAEPCFEPVAIEPATIAGPHLKMTLDLCLHNDPAKEFILGFISGFTFFTVPVWCTYGHTLDCKVFDDKGRELHSMTLKDDLQLWMHLVLILYPKSPSGAFREMTANLLRTVFQETPWERLWTS